MVLKLIFKDARTWRYVMNAVGKIIDEAAFRITEEGLRMKAIDPSRITLIDFFLGKESLDEFQFEKEEVIGVNMDDLVKILRRVVKGDELLLETLEGGRLAITFMGRGKRTFIIPSIETMAEEVPELKIPFKAHIKMTPSVFRDVVKELEPISDAIEFIAKRDEEKLIVKATSDLASATVELTMESGALIEFESEEEEARAIYTVDYLSDISGASQAAEELDFYFATAVPCKIDFTLPYGGKLVFYVAPRVE